MAKQTAKKGNWVQIRTVILKANERTSRIPKDTQKCDLIQLTKGFLKEESAGVGDEVTVITAVGRIVKGTLVDIAPCYKHNFGEFVPEIIQIEDQLKKIMFGGELQ